MAILEISHGTSCYICGTGQSHVGGIQVMFMWHEDVQKILADAVMGPDCQGAPGHAHGGALFGLLDEAMGGACWMSGHRVMTAHVGIDYRKPVKLGESIQIAAWIERIAGRKVHTHGELRVDGAIVTEAKGLFISSDRHAWDFRPPENDKTSEPL